MVGKEGDDLSVRETVTKIGMLLRGIYGRQARIPD